jgi:hypothetical protein
MFRFYEILDTLLSAYERLAARKWGQELIALVVGAVIWIFGIVRGIDPWYVTVGAIVVVGIALYVEINLPPLLRSKLAPPIEVEISGFGIDMTEPSPVDQEMAERLGRSDPVQPSITITAPIYVLNRAKKRRVSLEFPEGVRHDD